MLHGHVILMSHLGVLGTCTISGHCLLSFVFILPIMDVSRILFVPKKTVREGGYIIIL